MLAGTRCREHSGRQRAVSAKPIGPTRVAYGRCMAGVETQNFASHGHATVIATATISVLITPF